MADEDERVASPNGVFGPILLRSSTPPPSEKVSSFLRGMQNAQRVSKPVSNYGSEFEHMAGTPWDTAKGMNLIGGRPVTIPADAQDMHDLNEELFGEPGESELSYGGALNNNQNGNGYNDNGQDQDDIESVEQEGRASTVHQTPRQVPQQILSPGKQFRNGKVIDSSSSWGNKGPLPGGQPPIPQNRYQESNGYAPSAHAPPAGPAPNTPFINIQPPTASGAPSRSPSRMNSERSRSAAPKSHMSEVINHSAGPSNGQNAPPPPPPQDDTRSEHTERAGTVRAVQEVEVERPASRAPSRNGSRAPSRVGRSRAGSRAQEQPPPPPPQGVASPRRALSPTGRTERSKAPSATPSKVPLPNSTDSGGGYSYVPLHFSSPPKSPTHPASQATYSQRAQSPLSNGAPNSRAQQQPTPLRQTPSRMNSESAKSPTRLHPLTDILRENTGTPGKTRSRAGGSEQSFRTGPSEKPPTITVQVTGNSQAHSSTPSKQRSAAPPASAKRGHSRAPSNLSRSALGKEPTQGDDYDDEEDDYNDQMKSLVMHDNPSREHVTEIDLTRTPRTSYTAYTTPSVLAGEINASHFHDEELCVLLHAADNQSTHDVVKKVLRKGVRDRVKKLGLDHQRELAIARKHHQQGIHRHARALKAVDSPDDEKPPKWAEHLFDILKQQQHTIQLLEGRQGQNQDQALARASSAMRTNPTDDGEEGTVRGHGDHPTVDQGEDEDDYGDEGLQTPHMTIPIDTPHDDHDDLYADDHDGETRSKVGTATQREYDEDGTEFGNNPHLSKPELYRLRIKEPTAANPNEATWHVTDTNHSRPAQLPEIPGSDYMGDTHAPADEEELRHHEVQERGHDANSPPLPPLPLEAWSSQQSSQPPAWQRVYQRLLNWALVWSEGELQRALQSTMPGNHVDEVALTIWITQTYKRYVRAKHVEHPPGRVDRLYVPPNIADAINVAVFHGRHGDARTMLRDLWAPFGFEGMPRLLIVLARHRRDSNHYVVHRFALPEGSLTTYDTYPEKTLADGRPLGWWFAIQAAWPNAMYPQPDNLVQKIIRINRPMQLNVDNSVAAAAIWRNLIMGSKAERSVDLVRLRDLITTEVKSIISRKELGRLSVMGGKSQWEEIQP